MTSSPASLEKGHIPREHICVGNKLWYSGSTSMLSWDCPAEIIEVDEDAEWFRVRSLDDFLDQSQSYSFVLTENSPTSRRNMRAATEQEVAEYLNEIESSMRNRLVATRIVKLSRSTLPFAVEFEGGSSAHDFIRRWATRRKIEVLVDAGNSCARFKTMDDAVLFRMSLSGDAA